jgi:hypothetical protein
MEMVGSHTSGLLITFLEEITELTTAKPSRRR